MAIIQKLRNSGVVVIAIIVALVLFVISDLLFNKRGRGGYGDQDRDVVGIIFGKSVNESEVTAEAQKVLDRESANPDFKRTENSDKQMYDQAWSSIIRQKTLEAQMAKAGIVITDEDFDEMVLGDYPAEQLKSEQSFQTDGKYDPKKLKFYFDQAKNNPTLKMQLLGYVKDLKDRTLEQRYARYISKCIYTPKNERAFSYMVANQGVDGKLVSININTVQDKDIKVTDADLEKYLDEHKEEYKQAFETRDISYVVWDIIPSAKDSAYARDQANALLKSMAAEEKPDTVGEGVVGFVSRGKLPAETPKEVSEQVWPSKLHQVVGPFYKDGKYTVYQKVAEKKDSMPMTHVAHILIKFDGAEAPNKQSFKDSVAAFKKAQELASMVRGGKDIGELAGQWSMDPGSANNKGDYGWADPNTYVPAYKAFCIRAKKGTVEVVKTQYGYHVMKALDDPDYTQLKYRVKTIEITPGPETVKLVTAESGKFRNQMDGTAKTFEAVRDKMTLTPHIRKGIKTEDRSIPGLDQAGDVKSIMGWLFDDKRKTNDISDVFPFSSRHMVVLVSNVRTIGYAKVEDVKEKIEPLVRSELKARKLEEKFTSAMASAKTPEELAQKTGGVIIPLEGLKMGSNFIPQLFTEPKILGAIFGVKEKILSKPISGTGAVAVIWIDKKDKVEIPKAGLDENADFMNQPQFLANRLQEVLRAAAEIQDFRYKFSWF